MPDPISPISQLTTPAATGAGPTGRADQFGKDTFLKLLVAQLKYQNPTSPVDAQQFLAQSAQFSMVEKLDEIAKQTTDARSAQWAAASAGYLGRKVEGVLPDGQRTSGVVTGVRLDPSGPILQVGNQELALAMVERVSTA